MPTTVLIADDDPAQCRLLEAAVSRLGHRTVVVHDGREALDRLQAPDGDRFGLMILDLVMPELDGMGVLERLRDTGRVLPVIVQTAHGGVDAAVSAMRAGAIDFLIKPVSPERLQVTVQNALKLDALEGEIARIRRSASGTLTFRDLITRSPTMERVIRLGERAAASQIPILIEGESGVGKELIARAIQGSGERRAKPFIVVNCGALPDNLAESILFGHEKGAFTGAAEKHVGKFQEAHGGTLFLDEIGELSLPVQAKLLRALQEGEIDPVGGRRPVRVDFRLITATNRDLIRMVREGHFREDLYYRINVFPIRVPPLRERMEDVPELIRHFTARFAAEERKTAVRGVSAAALDLLTRHSWPGNIRQLENAVFRAVVLSDGPLLSADDFPQIAAQRERRPDEIVADIAAIALPDPPAPPEIVPSLPPLREPAFVPPGRAIDALNPAGDIRPMAEIEAEVIRMAIDHYGGRMALVARRLGIGRSTLYRRLKELGLDGEGDELAAE